MSDLPNDDDFEAIHYSEEGRAVDLRLEPDSQTIWATQAQIAELFATSQQTVSYHLGNVLVLPPFHRTLRRLRFQLR